MSRYRSDTPPEIGPLERSHLPADFSSDLLQQALDIRRQSGEPDAHHHGPADDLSVRLEVEKRAEFCRPSRQAKCPTLPQAKFF
jgi:hypothetical protein